MQLIIIDFNATTKAIIAATTTTTKSFLLRHSNIQTSSRPHPTLLYSRIFFWVFLLFMLYVSSKWNWKKINFSSSSSSRWKRRKIEWVNEIHRKFAFEIQKHTQNMKQNKKYSVISRFFVLFCFRLNEETKKSNNI